MGFLKHHREAHWYAPDGRPLFEAETKSGKNKGKARDYTLRDARKDGAFPSVTKIDRLRANFNVQNWKLDTLLEEAVTMPRLPNESTHNFCERVAAVYEANQERLANNGKLIHSGSVACVLSGEPPEPGTSFAGSIRSVLDYFSTYIVEILACEAVVVGDGWAGTLDFLVIHRDYGLCVLDLKTQEFKERNKFRPGFYESYAIQAATYARGTLTEFAEFIRPDLVGVSIRDIEAPRILTLVVDRNEDGDHEKVGEKIWDEDDQQRYALFFESLFEGWQHLNDYRTSRKVRRKLRLLEGFKKNLRALKIRKQTRKVAAPAEASQRKKGA